MLTRLQSLEEQLIDVQTSETRLKRLVKEQQDREVKLKCKLNDLETSQLIFGAKTSPSSAGDKERQWQLLQTIAALESSESSLKTKVSQLQKDDVDALNQVRHRRQRHLFAFAAYDVTAQSIDNTLRRLIYVTSSTVCFFPINFFLLSSAENSAAGAVGEGVEGEAGAVESAGAELPRVARFERGRLA